MSEGVNKVILLGNLGADPELRFTQAGGAVLNMRLATTRNYLDKNKVKQEQTDWHNVTLWGKRGEALGKFLTKGDRLYIEGRIQNSSYEDKEGIKRYKSEVIAENVVLNGKRDGNGAGRGTAGDVGEDASFDPSQMGIVDDDQP